MRRGGMAPASRTGAALLVLSGCLFSGALAQTPDLEAGRAVVVGGEDGSVGRNAARTPAGRVAG